MRSLCLALILFGVSCQIALGWGATGHRVVGEIGSLYLNAQARQKIESIIGKHSLAKLSTWPDEIKSEKAWRFANKWHYISVDDEESLDQVLQTDHVDGTVQNVVEAIGICTRVLEGEQEARTFLESQMKDRDLEPLFGSLDATALAFLIHFIGDIHQPLHVGRSDDRGGNNIRALWFGKNKKLHGIWDTDLVENDKLSFTEMVRFINHPTSDQVKSWQTSTVHDWANESIGLRAGLYASTYENMVNHPDKEGEQIANLRYEYAYVNGPIVKERMLQAGIRLAAVLNRIYGESE